MYGENWGVWWILLSDVMDDYSLYSDTNDLILDSVKTIKGSIC